MSKTMKRISTAASNAIAAKKARLEAEAQELFQAQGAVEQEEDLLDILTMLLECPEKIKECKKAVASNMFLKQVDGEPTFNRTLMYIHRLPQEHIKSLLCRLSDKIDRADLKTLWKEDHSVLVKLLCRACRLNPCDLIRSFSLKRADFDAEMLTRYSATGKIFEGGVATSQEGVVDWDALGIVKLLPPNTDGKKEHVFTEFSVGPVKVPLPKNLMLSGEIQIKDNFAIKSAYVKLDLGGKAMKKRFVDLVPKATLESDVWQQFAMAKADPGDEGDVSVLSASTESVGSANASGSSVPPAGSPRRLDREKLKKKLRAFSGQLAKCLMPDMGVAGTVREFQVLWGN